ncbi:MAG: ribonuclease III [Bacillota bacterium]
MKTKLDCIDKFLKKTGVEMDSADALPAFIHRSFLNETQDKRLENNERLEFLGDAVLELVATEFLYNKYIDKSEGELTALRSALVRGKNLSEVAEGLGIFDCLLLSKGESSATGKARGLILANTMEAIIGVIYIKLGLEKAREFINNHILHIIDDIISDKLYLDAKSEFQEKVQERDKVTPHYKVIWEKGPDHSKEFISGVYIGERLVAKGAGASKNQAEQNAARIALEKEF